MTNSTTIVELLHTFASHHKNITWKIDCCYSDGLGTTINQIKIYAHPGDKRIGIISYHEENGMVLFYMFKGMRIKRIQDIVNIILDMINLTNGQEVL